MAEKRLNSIVSQLSLPSSDIPSILDQNPEDIVITLAIRTPFTKARKGGFKDASLDYIVYSLLREVVKRSGLNPQLVDDVCMGNVNDAKAPYIIRAAMLAAGFPYTSGARTVNRFCSSGLLAVEDVANAIRVGAIDIGVAVGAESLSTSDQRLTQPFHDKLLENPDAADCMLEMLQTSENVAADFHITRVRQDEFAAESFRKAEIAQKAGWLDDEIVPIVAPVKDARTGIIRQVTLTKDEGPRYGTTVESLSRVQVARPEFGNTATAGNSSQVTDGAGAVILMKRSKALELGQPILGKFCGAVVAGVPPRIMGIGPTAAIPKLLNRFGLKLDDIDLIEINEAFASMAVYCLDNLKLDPAKLNPRGGAIALGHPLGATGIRQICTILSEARRTGRRILVTSMCIGTGQGMAGLLVNEML